MMGRLDFIINYDIKYRMGGPDQPGYTPEKLGNLLSENKEFLDV